jgi:hypothetical protein
VSCWASRNRHETSLTKSLSGTSANVHLPRQMTGGPGNPPGVRAPYLGDIVYRIHGPNAPETIGSRVSSGCIRLTHEGVNNLYACVDVGTEVIVLPMDRRALIRAPQDFESPKKWVPASCRGHFCREWNAPFL